MALLVYDVIFTLYLFFASRSKGERWGARGHEVRASKGVSTWFWYSAPVARFDGRFLTIARSKKSRYMPAKVRETILAACLLRSKPQHISVPPLPRRYRDIFLLRLGRDLIRDSGGRLPHLIEDGYTWYKPEGPVHPYPLRVDLRNCQAVNVNWKKYAGIYADKIVTTKSTEALKVYRRMLEIYGFEVPKKMQEKVGKRLFELKLDLS